MSETDTIKNRLRKQIKAMRKNMDADRKKKLDDCIFENLLKCDEFQNANTVLIYMSTKIEVNTDKIIRYCLENGIKTAIPRCFEKRKMKFYFYDGSQKLEKSDYGIYQPIDNEKNVLKHFENTVCILPALGFDENGYRLGYGGGYYDRFLTEHEEILPIMICYSENMTNKLVHNEFDRRAAFVVTEKGLEVLQ